MNRQRDGSAALLSERDVSSVHLEAWLAHGESIGVRERADALIFDVDPRNYLQPFDDPLRRIAEGGTAPLSDAPATIAGAGGLHLYLRKPLARCIVGKLTGYDDADILGEGGPVGSTRSPSARSET